MILIGDIESTGLDVNRDKVHCGVFKDFETGKVYEFRPHNLNEIGSLVDRADKVCFHNGIQFDAPILRSNGITDIPFEKVIDTLVLSRLYYPDRDGHSVEAWGERLGYPKVEHEDWSVFSEDMLFRCKTDVEIQCKIYEQILRERGDWDWDLAEKIEHRVQQILHEQEKRGWKFRLDRAKELVQWLDSEMGRVEGEIQPRLSSYYTVNGKVVDKPFTQSGDYSERVKSWMGEQTESVAGPFSKIEWHEVKLSQRDKLASKLIELGWQPTSYSATGRPQLTPDKMPCPNLSKLGDIGEKLSHYFLCAHRRGQIRGWIENCREDGRIPARVTGMTNTGRMKHGTVANVPKADDGQFLGKEMRSLFTCEDGYKLVGFDADGLEIRMAAHYTGSEPFIKAITEGKKEDSTDPHNRIYREAERYGVQDRQMGKKSVYTGIYGASGYKFAKELGVSKKNGFKIREIVGNAFPGLLDLRGKVESAAKRGYIIGLDGRKVWMRRNEKGEIALHKAMNTLFQSAGGIVMKFVLCVLDEWCKKGELEVHFVGNMHDEVQAEVVVGDVAEYRRLCYRAFQKATEYFKLRCPVTCEVKVSDNWAETH